VTQYYKKSSLCKVNKTLVGHRLRTPVLVWLKVTIYYSWWPLFLGQVLGAVTLLFLLCLCIQEFYQFKKGVSAEMHHI
jgi:hypothetical protein